MNLGGGPGGGWFIADERGMSEPPYVGCYVWGGSIERRKPLKRFPITRHRHSPTGPALRDAVLISWRQGHGTTETCTIEGAGLPGLRSRGSLWPNANAEPLWSSLFRPRPGPSRLGRRRDPGPAFRAHLAAFPGRLGFGFSSLNLRPSRL